MFIGPGWLGSALLFSQVGLSEEKRIPKTQCCCWSTFHFPWKHCNQFREYCYLLLSAILPHVCTCILAGWIRPMIAGWNLSGLPLRVPPTRALPRWMISRLLAASSRQFSRSLGPGLSPRINRMTHDKFMKFMPIGENCIHSIIHQTFLVNYRIL